MHNHNALYCPSCETRFRTPSNMVMQDVIRCPYCEGLARFNRNGALVAYRAKVKVQWSPRFLAKLHNPDLEARTAAKIATTGLLVGELVFVNYDSYSNTRQSTSDNLDAIRRKATGAVLERKPSQYNSVPTKNELALPVMTFMEFMKS